MAHLSPGTRVWIPDRDGQQVWIKAEVVSTGEQGCLEVKLESDASRCTLDAHEAARVLRCNADTWSETEGLTALDDLSVLTHLHEAEVLEALHIRYDIDKIYTLCGPILIAINPFKEVSALYDLAKFQPVAGTPLPHIYTVAQGAWANLEKQKQAQVILISGESGAGKTESTKYTLQYLTDKIRLSSGGQQDSNDEMRTEQRVLNANPLLEAFGNACTVRNDNSSRFGKFIELLFAHGTTSFECAAVETYLLEKVRLTELHSGERSYHIFYQACTASEHHGPDYLGLPLEHFGPASSFKYLNRSDRFTLRGVDDGECLAKTQASMTSMGISVLEQRKIFAVTAAVLKLGNLELQLGTGEVVAVKDECGDCLASICDILGVDAKSLQRSLTHRLITVSATEKYDSPLTLRQSEERRDSLARSVYCLLFDFIVMRINQCLAGAADMSNQEHTFVGVLDIFGFEHFEQNSLEQLCINFANEKLQGFFNNFAYKAELETYAREGIVCDVTDCPDNQGIIALIQGKRLSIFAMLDEECRLPKGSNQSFTQKLWKQFESHPNFAIEKRKPNSFTVLHYAGPVSYDSDNFMEKNVDEMGELLQKTLEETKDSFVKQLIDLKDAKQRAALAEPLSPTSPSSPARSAPQTQSKLKPNTVCEDFKAQLQNLMNKITSAGPHFIRCIKPNQVKLPDRFDRPSVTEQLRSGGVVEALKVQRAGFPARLKHQHCWSDLKVALRGNGFDRHESLPMEERLKLGLEHLASEFKWHEKMKQGQQPYAIGNATVFFKREPFEDFQNMKMSVQYGFAVKIQRLQRGTVCRQNYQSVRGTAIFLQANVRGCLVRRRYAKTLAAVVRIQSLVRKFLARCFAWNLMEPKTRRRSRLFQAYYDDLVARGEHIPEDEESEQEIEEEGVDECGEEEVTATGSSGSSPPLRLRANTEKLLEQERQRLTESFRAKLEALEEQVRLAAEREVAAKVRHSSEVNALTAKHAEVTQKLTSRMAEAQEQHAAARVRHALDLELLSWDQERVLQEHEDELAACGAEAGTGGYSSAAVEALEADLREARRLHAEARARHALDLQVLEWDQERLHSEHEGRLKLVEDLQAQVQEAQRGHAEARVRHALDLELLCYDQERVATEHRQELSSLAQKCAEQLEEAEELLQRADAREAAALARAAQLEREALARDAAAEARVAELELEVARLNDALCEARSGGGDAAEFCRELQGKLAAQERQSGALQRKLEQAVEQLEAAAAHACSREEAACGSSISPTALAAMNEALSRLEVAAEMSSKGTEQFGAFNPAALTAIGEALSRLEVAADNRLKDAAHTGSIDTVALKAVSEALSRLEAAADSRMKELAGGGTGMTLGAGPSQEDLERVLRQVEHAAAEAADREAALRLQVARQEEQIAKFEEQAHQSTWQRKAFAEEASKLARRSSAMDLEREALSEERDFLLEQTVQLRRDRALTDEASSKTDALRKAVLEETTNLTRRNSRLSDENEALRLRVSKLEEQFQNMVKDAGSVKKSYLGEDTSVERTLSDYERQRAALSSEWEVLRRAQAQFRLQQGLSPKEALRHPKHAHFSDGPVTAPQQTRARFFSEPTEGTAATKRSQSLRVARLPRKLSLSSSATNATVGSRRPSSQRSTLRDLYGRSTSLMSSATSALPRPSHKFAHFLGPTHADSGEAEGPVGIWKSLRASSPVTALCFEAAPEANSSSSDDGDFSSFGSDSDENDDEQFALLGVGFENGTFQVYRVARKLPLKHTNDARGDFCQVLDREAHDGPITQMFFYPGAKFLCTASADLSIATWTLPDGTLRRRQREPVAITALVGIPESLGSFVVCNENSVLQLVAPQERQKCRLDHPAQCLAVALEGERVLAGTRNGWMHAFEIHAGSMKSIAKQPISQAALTCAILVPSPEPGLPPLAVVNSMDDTMCILQGNASLTNFTVLHRLSNPHQNASIQCAHLHYPLGDDDPFWDGAGFVVSGAEDGLLRVFNLDDFSLQSLRGHSAAVACVAVAAADASGRAGVVASADAKGKVVLWRRGAGREDGA